MDEVTIVLDVDDPSYERYGLLYNGEFAGFGDKAHAKQAYDQLINHEVSWYAFMRDTVVYISDDGLTVKTGKFIN